MESAGKTLAKKVCIASSVVNKFNKLWGETTFQRRPK